MEFDENKTFAEIAIEMAQEADANEVNHTISIEKYLANCMDVNQDCVPESEKSLLCKNFIHLMCTVIEDLKSIDERLKDYGKKYKLIKDDKSNEAEFQRRKIIYFIDLNKQAKTEILDFLTDGISGYLRDNRFDTLRRVEEKDALSIMFLNRRYKYAYYKSFYDMDYDYGTCVKISEIHDEAPLEKWMDVENEYLKLKKNNPSAFQEKLKALIKEKDIVNQILDRVKRNYHLKKREEVFATLKYLLKEKKYQSFIALGLIQLEGLFYEYCQIKYGDKENQGTLVEKAEKALKGNEYKYMRFYPYFAFDVPIMRNDIAHKGLVEIDDIEEAAYDLILDLNTVSQMVVSESHNKFIGFALIHEVIIKWKPEEDEESNFSMYKTLVVELFRNRYGMSEHFWKMLKTPDNYRDEINFYAKDDLQEGYIDMSGIVNVISSLVRQDNFWKALLEAFEQYVSNTLEWTEFIDFTKYMKNEYIAELTGDAKKYCIELSKKLS